MRLRKNFDYATQEVREKAGDAVKSELLSKAFLDDSNVLVNFGSYLGKIGQHIALDIGETKDWVAKRLSGHASDDEEEAGEEDTEAASREAWVDVAHKKKKILNIRFCSSHNFGFCAIDIKQNSESILLYFHPNRS